MPETGRNFSRRLGNRPEVAQQPSTPEIRRENGIYAIYGTFAIDPDDRNSMDSVFHGIFQRDDDGGIAGSCGDRYGLSRIKGSWIIDRLVFEKQYHRHFSQQGESGLFVPIEYYYREDEGGVWNGSYTYTTLLEHTGSTRCWISEMPVNPRTTQVLPDDFLLPPPGPIRRARR